MTGFDKAIVKRQLYHMMFLDEETNSPFSTVAYSDLEYLDEYEGLNGVFAEYVNSGLQSFIDFDALIKLPNYFVDWLIKWSTKRQLQSSKDSNAALEEIERELAQANKASNSGVKPNGSFMNKY